MAHRVCLGKARTSQPTDQRKSASDTVHGEKQCVEKEKKISIHLLNEVAADGSED